MIKTTKANREERGVALVLTIFGLLLLTGIVATMMFSSDAETQIAINYRDKQSAVYSAMSGVQEARDRLQPLSGDLSGFAPVPGPGPTALPAAANNGVLYIINPNKLYNEVVAPWDPKNQYFDKELCQEQYMVNTLNVTQGTPGIACANNGALPAACSKAGSGGKGWCTYYDESANNTGWKLQDANGNAIPMDYKWVRISLKADNSGLVYVQTPATPANGTQVCWENSPNQQLQLPAGAGTTCLGANAGASLACATAGQNPPCALTLGTGGSGYSLLAPPTVSFTGGGGSGATATATVAIVPGGIASGTISNPGAGYTSPPTVSIVTPDGTGAALTALLTGSPITAVSVAGNNYCYASTVTAGNFTVNFIPSPSGTGNTAAATVTMTGGTACVASFSASASCSSMKNKSALITSIPGATGGGFSGTVNFDKNGKVGSVSVTNVGSYTSVPATASITVSGCTITGNFSGGIQIASVPLGSGGSYVSAPSASLSGPNPTEPSALQPTLNTTWAAAPTNGQIAGIQVTTPGIGYAKPSYVLSFSGGSGAGAVGTALSSATGTVTGVTLTNAGANYTTAPTISFGNPGAGASATVGLTGAQKLLLGEVYMLTSMAVTHSGSQAMIQMEAGVVPPSKIKFQLGGALTIAGDNPDFGTPNSNNFVINGNDADSCGEAVGAPLPAIGVANSAAEQCVVSGTTSVPGQTCTGLGKTSNYIGAQSAPDVQVASGANPSAEQLVQLATDFASAKGAVNFPPLTGPFQMCVPSPTVTCPTFTSVPATPTTSSVTVVNGNLTLSGNPSGNGVLVVTGNLTLSGNFSWNGLILVLGTANSNSNGGGNGQINGALYIGNTNGGVSNFNWNGGGGNGIRYDHCLADDLINNLPPPPSSDPLQVLSTRMLEF